MLAVRLLILSILFAVSGCASKKTAFEEIGDLPPTAASGETELNAHVWTGVGGKPVRNLVRNIKYPHQPTSIERITILDFPDQRGDQYGQRITGLISVPTTGEYQFWGSGDESFEIWLSIDSLPENKRLIAYANKPTGYLVWDRYGSQKSSFITLEAGERYFFEVLHKEYTGADYLTVSWTGPGFELTPLTEEHLLPMGEADSVSGETAFKEGYHTGYTAGTYLAAFDDTYPIVDSDGDGLPDFYELLIGLDPQDITDAYSDLDGDLLSAYEEFRILTNPTNADSDSDGLPDGFEYVYGLNALDAADASLDLDGDGVSNSEEYAAGTAPDDQADFPAPEPEPEPDPIPVPSTQLVAFNWEVPKFREDGSSLAASEIKSYKVYSGVSPDTLQASAETSDGAQSSITQNLGAGVYYYALSTVLLDGTESQLSGLMTVTVASDGSVSSSYDQGSGTGSGDSGSDSGTGDPALADTDGDGMTDEFELLYGLDPLDPADALLDSDQDGISNVDEFLAGSDPATNESAAFPPQLVTLTWSLPTTREDGTALYSNEIKSYRIYSGSSSGNLSSVAEIQDPSQITWSSEYQVGTHYFAISTVTIDGVEGSKSQIQSVVVQ